MHVNVALQLLRFQAEAELLFAIADAFFDFVFLVFLLGLVAGDARGRFPGVAGFTFLG